MPHTSLWVYASWLILMIWRLLGWFPGRYFGCFRWFLLLPSMGGNYSTRPSSLTHQMHLCGVQLIYCLQFMTGLLINGLPGVRSLDLCVSSVIVLIPRVFSRRALAIAAIGASPKAAVYEGLIIFQRTFINNQISKGVWVKRNDLSEKIILSNWDLWRFDWSEVKYCHVTVATPFAA